MVGGIAGAFLDLEWGREGGSGLESWLTLYPCAQGRRGWGVGAYLVRVVNTRRLQVGHVPAVMVRPFGVL
mgnify:CR=1 FL=1